MFQAAIYETDLQKVNELPLERPICIEPQMLLTGKKSVLSCENHVLCSPAVFCDANASSASLYEVLYIHALQILIIFIC